MTTSRPSRRLQSLTSLRFFFGALVVIAHMRGVAGVPLDALEPYAVQNSVTFFFVLSGFILTYSYGHQQPLQKKRFLLARFARLWPAHVTALVFFLFAYPQAFHVYSFAQFVANLCMLHTWIPLTAYNASFVGASWSISTEFAFYLCFLFLVRNWERTWHIKLALCAGLTLGMIWLANFLSSFFSPLVAEGLRNSLMYFNPLTRLFEFVLGMATAELWKRFGPKVNINVSVATVLEIGFIAIILWFMHSAFAWAQAAGRNDLIGRAGIRYLQSAGICCIPFAVLIFLMACERGLLSRWLAYPFLVLLGELSYSTYLFHQIFIHLLRRNARAFDFLPRWVLVSGLCVAVMLSALLLWLFVERPARAFLVSLWPRSRKAKDQSEQLSLPALPSGRTPVRERILPSTPFLRWATLACGLSLLALLTSSAYYVSSLRIVSEADATEIIQQTPPPFQSVAFSDRFRLEGFSWKEGRTDKEKRLELVWRSLALQPLQYRTAVHFVDSEGKMCSNGDQEPFGTELPANTLWRTIVTFTPRDFRRVTQVAIGLLKGDQWLFADRGPRDWGNRRLLIPLPEGYRGSDIKFATTNYEGFLETANGDSISGWVWNKDQPDKNLKVEVLDGESLVATLGATNTRPDQIRGNLGTGTYGFVLPTPPQLKDGQRHRIHVRVAGGDFELTGSPHTVKTALQVASNSTETPAPAPHRTALTMGAPAEAQPAAPSGKRSGFQIKGGYLMGNIETASPESITGWALSKEHPDQSLTVEIMDGDVLVTNVIANRSRPDFIKMKIGTGAYGFVLPTPASFTDGRPHDIHVRFAGTAFELDGSPKKLEATHLAASNLADNRSIAALQRAPLSPTGPVNESSAPARELPATQIPSAACTGYLEIVNEQYITGWVLRKDQLDQSLNVDILDGTFLLQTVTASNLRPDFVKNKFGTGRYGFALTPPALLKDGKPHQIHARVSGSTFELSGSPQTLQVNSLLASTRQVASVSPVQPEIAIPQVPAKQQAPESKELPTTGKANSYEGYLEVASNEHIIGWVWSKDQPGRKLDVEILDGGSLLMTAPATNARPDLVKSNVGTGNYGFSVPAPSLLKDGRLHQIHVRVVGDNFELENSPKTIPANAQLAVKSAESRAVNPAERAIPGQDSHGELQPVNFSGRFILASWHWAAGTNASEIELNLVWRSVGAERLDFLTEVHLLDAKGTSLWDFNFYEDDPGQNAVAAGTVWRRPIKFPVADLSGGTHLAISLSKDEIWLLPSQGAADSDNRRFLIPLPRGLSAIASTQNTPFQGWLESADAAAISGWAWNKLQPDTRLKIDIFDGAVPLTSLLATNTRPDLLTAKIGDGAYGFRLPTPLSLKDGRPHEIRARISGEAFELKDSPKVLLLKTAPSTNAPVVKKEVKAVAAGDTAH